VASRFDLMIGGYGPLETGARGIQLFADLSFDDELRRAFHSVPDGWKGHWFHEGCDFRL
jgi:hypothetical protein